MRITILIAIATLIFIAIAIAITTQSLLVVQQTVPVSCTMNSVLGSLDVGIFQNTNAIPACTSIDGGNLSSGIIVPDTIYIKNTAT